MRDGLETEGPSRAQGAPFQTGEVWPGSQGLGLGARVWEGRQTRALSLASCYVSVLGGARGLLLWPDVEG